MLISVNTFWTILLIVHGLLAIALLGALTHQAMAVLMPVRHSAGGFVTRFRAVPAAGSPTDYHDLTPATITGRGQRRLRSKKPPLARRHTPPLVTALAVSR